MISVVVSTYNSPEWLEKVLWGYTVQTEKRFELVIADDGSTGETKTVIERFRNETGLPIQHVWQEDIGFRKTRICNQAFLQARYDYILCADGDCIPRTDLLETHLRYARPGRFLCGTAIRMSRITSKEIDREAIISGNAFRVRWLLKHGMQPDQFVVRLAYPRWFQPIANRYLCSNPRFNGGNSSAWKQDILRVNGYDEDLSYGGEDWEMGFRMEHLGIEAYKIRCSAHCLHLDHDRPYATVERRNATQAAKRKTLETRATYALNGIVKRPVESSTIHYEPSYGTGSRNVEFGAIKSS